MWVFLLSSLLWRAWCWREVGLQLCADLTFFGQGDEPATRSRETALEPLAVGEQDSTRALVARTYFSP